jgi:hypothetical protein
MEHITWSLYAILVMYSVGAILNLYLLVQQHVDVEQVNTINLQWYIYIPAPLVLLDYLY